MSEQEQVICNAILIKNVWEIRSRDQFQKQHNEDSRKEKSALERINQEWQSRMGDKYKPRRKQRKAPPTDAPPPPPRIRVSVRKTQSPEFSDRQSGLSVARRPMLMEKKASPKTDKLSLLSLLKTSAPSGSMWSSSWKFSKSPGEGSERPEGSEWGTPWKCMNFQPQMEGKAWNEQEYAHAEWSHNAELKEGKWWERTHNFSDTLESLERQLSSDWEISWKYKKSHGEKHEHTSHEHKHSRMARLKHLESSHHRNEQHSSEWSESWQSTKPSEGGNVHFEDSTAQNGEHQHEEQSDSKWGTSWKYLNSQYHALAKGSKKSSGSMGWRDAWKVSKPVEYSANGDHSSGASYDVMDHEPLDPHIHGEIVSRHRAEKHRCWSALHDEGKTPLTEWGKSWEGAKNATILAHVKPRKKEEPKAQEKKVEGKEKEESEPTGLPKKLKPKDRLAIREKYLKPLSKSDFSYEWSESWKSHRSESNKRHWEKHSTMNKPAVHQPHFEVRCLPDWKESWKCARFRRRFGKPSVTEWKNSSLFGYELKIGKEQGLKSDKCEVFALPKRGVRTNILNSLTTMEKHSFLPEWKDSVQSLKHQIVKEVPRYRPHKSKPFRNPGKEETPVTEWSKAWKFTNVTFAQDNNLWDHGWSSTENIRQDRWANEQAYHDQGVPHNGPTGSKGWGDSWKFTRKQHRVEGATAGQHPIHHHHQGSQLGGGWENSWRVSRIHHRHNLRNKPTMNEWWESWEFSGYHWYERPPKEKFIQMSMEIVHRRHLHHTPRKGQVSQSFNPDVFKHRVPPTDWMESWKMGALQRHHKRHPIKSRYSLTSPLHEVMNNPDWSKTWKLINLLSHQEQALWDHGWETFEVDKRPPPPKYVPMSHGDSAQSSNSEWGTSWKICGPQPLDWDDTPKAFHRKEKVLWSKRRYYETRFSHVKLDALPVRQWGTSWRFMKLESSLSPMPQMSETSSHSHTPHHKSHRAHKEKKHLYSNIEKSKPQPKRWADATKLAKTQPRPKRGPMKGAKGHEESENKLFDWLNSWKLSNDSVSSKEDTMSWAEWVNSWKFLIGSYPPEKKGSPSKSF